jgi:hypothetical protein
MRRAGNARLGYGVLGVLVMVSLLLVACASGPPSGPVEPRYKTFPGGAAEVIGYLDRSELEGGFWAVYDVPPNASNAVEPSILAVLLPGSVDEQGIAALKGRYVWASGRVSTGASIRMAGPEILVDGIDVAMAP